MVLLFSLFSPTVEDISGYGKREVELFPSTPAASRPAELEVLIHHLRPLSAHAPAQPLRVAVGVARNHREDGEMAELLVCEGVRIAAHGLVFPQVERAKEGFGALGGGGITGLYRASACPAVFDGNNLIQVAAILRVIKRLSV